MQRHRFGRIWHRIVRHARHIFLVVLSLPLLFGLVLLSLVLIKRGK